MKYEIRTSIIAVFLSSIVLLPFLPIILYFKAIKKKPFTTLLATLLFILTTIWMFYYFIYLKLPNINKLLEYKPITSSKMYDRNNELIFEIGAERRVMVKIKDVPSMLINAFLAAEDKSFYEHRGVDFVGLLKVMVLNISKVTSGDKLAGASTITQQVVKNILLSNERTLSRKLKEIILSYQISKYLSKDQILELYLNHIYLGMQSYGIVAAAHNYFDKTLSQLTISEMATLASMPKAPSALNPVKNKKRLLARRNWVLSEMLKTKMISDSIYQHAVTEELKVAVRQNNFHPFYAPATFAKNMLINSQYQTENNLSHDGHSIKLTIDGNLQRIAQAALEKQIDEYTKDHGYSGPIYHFSEKELLSSNPLKELNNNLDIMHKLEKVHHSYLVAFVTEVKPTEVSIKFEDDAMGKILFGDLAWARKKITETEVGKVVKNCNEVLTVGDVIFVKRKNDTLNLYSLEEPPQVNGAVVVLNAKNNDILAMVGGYKDEAGNFNRAVQAFRQIGSTIKPFVYATALENGITPNSIFVDSDISINLGNGVIWTPKNHTHATIGPITIRTGLERSVNTVTIRLADKLGIGKIQNAIQQFNLNDNVERNLSIVLGTTESSLLQVALAYSVFIHNGELHPASIISEMTTTETEKALATKLQFYRCDKNATCPVEQIIESSSNEAEVMDGDVAPTENYKRIISPQSAYQMLSMLEGAVIRGTAHILSSLKMSIAAKTGTSDGGQSIWTAAITPDLIIATYMGHDIPKNTNNYGSQYTAQIVKTILSETKEDNQTAAFVAPNGLKYIRINRKTGNKANSFTPTQDVITEIFKINDNVTEEQNTEQNSGDLELTY